MIPINDDKFFRISDDEFFERFRPLGPGDGPLAIDELPPGIDPAYVWTWVDTDEGDCIASGRLFVNRIGYWICRVPVPQGEYYEATLESTTAEHDPCNE